MFKGSFTALITPFTQGHINDEDFIRFVNYQIEQGTDGVVACGTTGEGATMTYEEHAHIIELCVKTANKRIPVIAGTGSNDTQKTIKMTKTAKELGADAALIVTPYYNKPNQEGLYQHFKAVHDAVDLPIILYNVPSRTAVNLTVETIARLSQLPRIVGIKDATPDILRPLEIRRVVPADFSILSGEDATIVAFLAHGGDGCISVTANIAPKECADLHKAWARKDWAEIERLRDFLLPLHQAMFVETNPCPAKYAAAQLGFGDGSVRLPLWEISDSSKDIVKAAMNSVFGG